MQSRLVLQRSTSLSCRISKSSRRTIHDETKRSSSSSSSSTSSLTTHTSSNLTSSNISSRRRIRPTNTTNFQSPQSLHNISITHFLSRPSNIHSRQLSSRYVQTSSTTNSPAVESTPVTSLRSSNETSNNASPSPSSIDSTDINNSSSNSNNDETLNFTNATIQRLLQEELFAIESLSSSSFADIDNNIQKNNVLLSPFDNSHLQNEMKTDIKQALKQKQLEQQQKYQGQYTNETNNTNNNNINTKPTMAQLLSKFDPQSPPPPDASLDEIQQWLECSAQQESVEKYEAMIESTRQREDYTSLSLVQRHLLEWYNPLRQRIQEEQEHYFAAKKRKTSENKYGPYLCTLQPEKLALLTSHEATMFALKRGGDSATLVTMALKISDAIEAEVNVQRLLKKRMDEQRMSVKEQQKNKNRNTNGDGAGMDSINTAAATTPSYSDPTMENDNDPAKQLKNNMKNNSWMYGPSHLQRFIDELNRSDPTRKGKIRIQRANRRAMQLLDSVEPWPTSEKVMLGVVLIQMLVETAKIDLRGKKYNHDDNNSGVPAFIYEKRWLNQEHTVGCVAMNEDFYKMVVEDKFSSLDAYTNRHKPMVIPPKDWIGYNEGGYSVLNTDFMRTKGCQIQKDALREADLSVVMDGLNVLGRVPWVINKNVLCAAERCWDEGIVLGDIPSRIDHDLPPAPLRPDGSNKDYEEAQGEFRMYRESLQKYRRVYQKNMDLRSLRCSAILKLNQADQFKNFEKIYFPYNVDFRGRAYPVPPHLSNIGSDLCRGMLTFAEKKPLGPRGLYWLKVHLANLAGNDKISFDDRATFTDDNMHNVRACVDEPFGENRWWMTLDDPFQAMATCHEIVAAIDSGSPETFESSLPVHMDGSCNGLQHYAALGRDTVGGTAVNLCPSDKPQDVYSGVMVEVIRRVAEEAERMLDIDESNPDKLTKNERRALADHRAARLVNGLIDRGVVKRTVMTSVYGVTYIGAKKQIEEKIKEKLEAKGVDVDERAGEIYAACGYLATVTMEVMGDLFQGARQTMNWLTTCANLISSQGQPVSWLSPTGVPAVQPYRQKQPYTIVTLLQAVVLINNSDNLPIHKSRQTSAFPPNYIHSLDSAHMLLTAIEMDKRGLTFSAVHDSFWTHAADIDEMNDVLRCCFIDLYNKPLLEELKDTWELQYPSLDFPDLPERGELDLNLVRKAPYFFQ